MARLHASTPGTLPRRPKRALADLTAAGSGLDKDWIEACRTRVHERMLACNAPPVADRGLPQLLDHALAALRALRADHRS